MDIAFFGASLVSAYDYGAATYFRGILHALSRLGHRIHCYEPMDLERLAYRDIIDPDWAYIVRFTPDGAGVETALDAAAKADVIIKSSGVGVYDELLDTAIPHAARGRALTVYWDLNPARTLESLRAAPDHPSHEWLPWYDLVVTRYGGASVLDELQRFGARTCFPIYNALDPETNHPVTADLSCANTMVFLGHRHEARDERIIEYLFEAAQSLPNYRFALGGCGWEGVPLPPNVNYLGYVYTGEHNMYYASANTALNVTDPRNIQIGYAPSARLFEAVGAGACVITDTWDGLPEFLEPDTEVLIANGGAEVVEHLLTLSSDRALMIGKRAQAHARAEHTYLHRTSELIALLEGSDSRWDVSRAL